MKIIPIIIKTIVLIAFTFLGFNAKTQTFIYFNYRYDISENGLKDDCYAIVETEDGFVLAGSSLVISGNIYWWEEKLTKMDENGMIQYIKTYGEDSIDFFYTNSGCLIEDDNYFYAVGKRRTPTSNWVYDEATLMLLDENLDSIWMRKYAEKEEPFDTAYLFTCLQKINQNNLIIAGSWMPYGLAAHSYLVKADSSGQLIWEKSYGYSGSYIEAYSVSQTSDQGFILGCFKYTPGYNYTVDPLVIKTDSLGNREWTKNLGGAFMDNKAMVCISKDSLIVVGTNYADSMYTPDVGYSKINIIKLDNMGNIIWNKKYGASKPHNFLLNIRVLNDSSIIAVGSLRKYNPEPDWVGWILKTNSDGDSLWYREYYNLPGQESKNYLYDIIETSDNGLIACGYVNPYLPDTGSTDTWVIKLDSIGCEWAGCDTTVGIEEQGGGEAWKPGKGEEGKRGQLEVWPNPASGVLSVKCLGLSSGKDLKLDIYDIFGRNALADVSPSPKLGEGQGGGNGGRDGSNGGLSGGWTVDVSSLPPGIYLAVVRDEATIVANAKFVVTH